MKELDRQIIKAVIATLVGGNPVVVDTAIKITKNMGEPTIGLRDTFNVVGALTKAYLAKNMLSPKSTIDRLATSELSGDGIISIHSTDKVGQIGVGVVIGNLQGLGVNERPSGLIQIHLGQLTVFKDYDGGEAVALAKPYEMAAIQNMDVTYKKTVRDDQDETKSLIKIQVPTVITPEVALVGVDLSDAKTVDEKLAWAKAVIQENNDKQKTTGSDRYTTGLTSLLGEIDHNGKFLLQSISFNVGTQTDGQGISDWNNLIELQPIDSNESVEQIVTPAGGILVENKNTIIRARGNFHRPEQSQPKTELGYTVGKETIVNSEYNGVPVSVHLIADQTALDATVKSGGKEVKLEGIELNPDFKNKYGEGSEEALAHAVLYAQWRAWQENVTEEVKSERQYVSFDNWVGMVRTAQETNIQEDWGKVIYQASANDLATEQYDPEYRDFKPGGNIKIVYTNAPFANLGIVVRNYDDLKLGTGIDKDGSMFLIVGGYPRIGIQYPLFPTGHITYLLTRLSISSQGPQMAGSDWNEFVKQEGKDAEYIVQTLINSEFDYSIKLKTK